MKIVVEVGATVLDDRKPEIGVGGFDQSGKHDTAGGDAEQDERVNVVDAQNHGEVGACEGAHAVLGDDNFVFFRGNNGWDRSERTLKQLLMLG